MINTIILDIGNVLARFGWKEYLLESRYSEEQVQRISMATVYSEAWKEWDRGSMTTKEMSDICCRYDTGMEKEIRQFFNDVYSIVQEFDYSQQFVKRLKENGYKVYLLSNFNGGHYRYCQDHFTFMKYVDGGVISYEVNHVKPEPQIYKMLLDKYQINPAQAVFLDDMLENLETARQFGLHNIHVESYEQAIIQLRELGINI